MMPDINSTAESFYQLYEYHPGVWVSPTHVTAIYKEHYPDNSSYNRPAHYVVYIERTIGTNVVPVPAGSFTFEHDAVNLVTALTIKHHDYMKSVFGAMQRLSGAGVMGTFRPMSSQ